MIITYNQNIVKGGMRKMVDKETLGQYTKIVVETDEENPVTIAVIQSNSVDTVKGYRVRLTPKYN